MKQFALIGAAGYVAPRHMKAIRDTGNNLAVAMDINDSVGIIDSYAPDAVFFTEFGQFDQYIYKMRQNGQPIDYMSIASPNHLHEAQISYALRNNMDVICEKPLVLHPRQIDNLKEIERSTGRKVNTILQLRLHPKIVELHERYAGKVHASKADVDLTYVTSRGNWFQTSWKGEIEKSGGIATNIGCHFFDMLNYIFGDLQESVVHLNEGTRSAGYLEFENARVRWFLSVDSKDLPHDIASKGQRTYRSITINSENVEFSDGFGDLHTKCYEQILEDKGFGIEENRDVIQIVSDIRNSTAQIGGSVMHPFVSGQF